MRRITKVRNPTKQSTASSCARPIGAGGNRHLFEVRDSVSRELAPVSVALKSLRGILQHHVLPSGLHPVGINESDPWNGSGH